MNRKLIIILTIVIMTCGIAWIIYINWERIFPTYIYEPHIEAFQGTISKAHIARIRNNNFYVKFRFKTNWHSYRFIYAFSDGKDTPFTSSFDISNQNNNYTNFIPYDGLAFQVFLSNAYWSNWSGTKIGALWTSETGTTAHFDVLRIPVDEWESSKVLFYRFRIFKSREGRGTSIYHTRILIDLDSQDILAR